MEKEIFKRWFGKDPALVFFQVFFVFGIYIAYASWLKSYIWEPVTYIVFNLPIGLFLIRNSIIILNDKERSMTQLMAARIGILISIMVLLPRVLFITIAMQ
ncbi:MAG: hypothetical protein UV57_C0027G0016 [Parcubacteria group bacterium GW2011_GWD2_43_10]|uniref:Uncharacterized protein n=3 Tax=Parcubacteria group TaxID=1794811 RepID=A0A1G2Q2G9_9BACT|nr:MAG: hypothetical protein UV11_C0047G0003 [Candidatus Giovannonibacteria bacterium GW2011_GWF2_42_19]KKS82913.1 MAG: hypothetical protein UV57_C0027G0016 [Parcubacteria group bacterium GW2011_GWD2_43_10]OHA54775.1 MAG: hypothetical protein A2226_00955 [Candidatus Veblenbacteria bacterium RIFOXYA2_FULL_43_9]OHA56900.1 MAG: hypothetical protein A2441_00130 [Candidatus Veblenbacteria bacterium RIFOXYC2_FULL_42_11]HAO81107.1 hypothetical protein [Candidatus Veblenbacteria bacterium]